MSTPENDPTDLRPDDSIRVAEIRAALIAEMREGNSSSQSKQVINDVRELKEDALSALQHTMRHSQNESLKARVSMWTLDKIIDAEQTSDDPMTEFLKQLPTTSTNEATNTTTPEGGIH